jgi:hypothetical protein
MTQAAQPDIAPVCDIAPARNQLALFVWCIVAAFGAYFCTYAFRRPFAAGVYQGITLWGMEYKTVLVIAQTFGYALSKFIGIKVIAEMPPGRRVLTLVFFISVAEAALLLFGLTPAPWNWIFLFLNGLPLGMVFGLVLGFLEGRRQTELLTASMCVSFIVADGVTRSVGQFLMERGVPEMWMPFTTGLLFMPPLWFFSWMLSRIPAPSREDIAARSARAPMNSADRWGFFRRYGVGLVLLVLVYLLISVVRSVRGDFSREIWHGLDMPEDSTIFARTEMAVGLAILVLSGMTVWIRSNRLAFFTALGLAMTGALIIAAALAGLAAGLLSPLWFMVVLGLGIYLPYVVVHTTVFERLIALTRDRGNIGYLMYIADSFGYLGYVIVLLWKTFFPVHDNFVDFFIAISWTIAIGCVLLLIPCWIYFAVLAATKRQAALEMDVLLEKTTAIKATSDQII